MEHCKVDDKDENIRAFDYCSDCKKMFIRENTRKALLSAQGESVHEGKKVANPKETGIGTGVQREVDFEKVTTRKTTSRRFPLQLEQGESSKQPTNALTIDENFCKENDKGGITFDEEMALKASSQSVPIENKRRDSSEQQRYSATLRRFKQRLFHKKQLKPFSEQGERTKS